jgi:hypothetical protein
MDGTVASRDAPPLSRFNTKERALIRRLDTPRKVQAWLHKLPYNTEPRGPTLRTLRGVMRTGQAHCAEAALAAAAILEQYGWPPRLLVFDSIDGLGHVLYLWKENGALGTVARSRDPGLHGRQPTYRNLRSLAHSYIDPYIDYTGCINGYTTFDLRDLPPDIDWRLSPKSELGIETILNGLKLRRVKVPKTRLDAARLRYAKYREAHNGQKPTYYRNRGRWL